ncbi:MAG: ABC transporter permease [Pseudomonadota bacterium]
MTTTEPRRYVRRHFDHSLPFKIRELYQYRSLLWTLSASELKLRYRRSVLGFLWTLLNPLLMMIVLSAVFSTIMRFDIKNYSVLLLSGLLPWTFFVQSVTGSLMSIVGKEALIKKVYLPKAVIPLSSVVSNFVNFSLSLLPFIVLTAALSHPITHHLIYLPLAMLLLAVFTAGVSFLFSCLNVYFRDFGHMTEVLIQAWFYLSPIIYTLEIIPERYRAPFMYNPMYYFIECFRGPIYYNRSPDTQILAIATGSALIAFLLGFFIFTKYERNFVLRV